LGHVSGRQLEEATSNFGSALQAGVVSNNSEVVEFILSYGADANVKGGCYGTCIRAAVEIEDLDMCRLLISGGADVNLTIVASETALLSAVTMENLDICQLFLTSGTTILAAILGFTIRSRKVQNVTRGLQCEHQRQRRPLRHCSSSSRQAAKPGACAALLDHGANLNIIGGEFGTVLHAAVVCGRVGLCSMLTDDIADVNAVSNGDTALCLAARNKRGGLVWLLLGKGLIPRRWV
jgi:ankyrin repeat protein